MGRLIHQSRALALLALLPALACTSLEGARLYASGTRALDAGQAEQAVADLEAAAARLPEASEVQNHLGLAYASAGRSEEATAAFERAVAIDCDNAAAKHNLRAARAGNLHPPEDSDER